MCVGYPTTKDKVRVRQTTGRTEGEEYCSVTAESGECAREGFRPSKTCPTQQ